MLMPHNVAVSIPVSCLLAEGSTLIGVVSPRARAPAYPCPGAAQEGAPEGMCFWDASMDVLRKPSFGIVFGIRDYMS